MQQSAVLLALTLHLSALFVNGWQYCFIVFCMFVHFYNYYCMPFHRIVMLISVVNLLLIICKIGSLYQQPLIMDTLNWNFPEILLPVIMKAKIWTFW